MHTTPNSLQDNILFGAPYDEARYKKGIYYLLGAELLPDYGLVILQCGLTRDLELFEAGDMTEVGEKGLTLRYVLYPSSMNYDNSNIVHSGGQKVREKCTSDAF